MICGTSTKSRWGSNKSGLILVFILHCFGVSRAVSLEKAGQNQLINNKPLLEVNSHDALSMVTASLNPSTEDTKALVDFYISTRGQSWDLSCRWNTSESVTTWYGVEFDTTTMKVTGVSLSGCFLVGPIPVSIGNLTSLITLDLSKNKLSGTIPISIGNLVSLLTLNLYDNSLKGSIPSSISHLSSLQVLQLYQNMFVSTLPESIGNLSSLQTFDCSRSMLIGTIPSSIGQLQSMVYLDLHKNKLTGSLPSTIGKLTLLIALKLYENLLSSTLPYTIGNMISLQVLAMSSNTLTGTLPSSLGDLSSSLISFSFSLNSLTGSIPTAIGNIIDMKYFELDHNLLTGVIPESIGDLSTLVGMLVHFNVLTGTLPAFVGLLTSLQTLDIDSNMISGSLPLINTSTSAFIEFLISSNHFEGQIPSSLCLLRNIATVTTAHNNFSCYEGCLQTVTEGYYDYMLHDEIPLCGNQQQTICNLADFFHLDAAFKDPYTIRSLVQTFPTWNATKSIKNRMSYYEGAIHEFEVSFGRDMTPSFGSFSDGLDVKIECFLCTGIKCVSFSGQGGLTGADFPGVNGHAPFVSSDPTLVVSCSRSVIGFKSDNNFNLPGFDVHIKRQLKYNTWDCGSKPVREIAAAMNPCNLHG